MNPFPLVFCCVVGVLFAAYIYRLLRSDKPGVGMSEPRDAAAREAYWERRRSKGRARAPWVALGILIFFVVAGLISGFST